MKTIICTMGDVRGDILGPPHGTTPAAVIANKNKTDHLRAVSLIRNGYLNRHLLGNDSSSLTNEKDHHYFLNSADVCW